MVFYRRLTIRTYYMLPIFSTHKYLRYLKNQLDSGEIESKEAMNLEQNWRLEINFNDAEVVPQGRQYFA